MHPLVNCGPVTSGPTPRAAPGRASAHRERGAVHAPGTGVSPSHGWVTARAGHRPGDATACCRMRDTAPALNTARSAPRIRPRHPFPLVFCHAQHDCRRCPILCHRGSPLVGRCARSMKWTCGRFFLPLRVPIGFNSEPRRSGEGDLDPLILGSDVRGLRLPPQPDRQHPHGDQARRRHASPTVRFL